MRELRKSRRMTMKEFGERFNLAESTISGYENGTRKPDIDQIKKFAIFFEVTTDYLLGVELFGHRLGNARRDKKMIAIDIAKKIDIPVETYKKYEQDLAVPDDNTLVKIATLLDVSSDYLFGRTNQRKANKVVTVAGQEITLSIEELKVFNELKKHPIMFHDLASDPEAKVKELIKLYKAQKFLENDDEDLGDGFGELED